MPAELSSILLRSAVAIALLMTAVWLESLRRRDASIVDLFWGAGFVLVAWTSFYSANSFSSGGRYDVILLPILTTVWGSRLSLYLLWRNHRKPEDFRYRAMRKKWGNSFPLVSLLSVFGVQGLVMWVVSLPLQAGVVGAFRSVPLFWIGVVLFAVGLLFESVGDWQLARFKLDESNSNRVLDTGLWRYTRHPNYFGDFVVWWGLFLISVAQSGVWWTVVGPVVMSIFLMKISGVTLLEKSLLKNKPKYADYVARTNAFFPGPPRNAG